MRIVLRDHFPDAAVIQDGVFSHFGNPASELPGALAFCDNIKNLEQAIRNANVSCVLTRRRDMDRVGGLSSKGLVMVDHPRRAYWQVFVGLAERGLLKPDMAYGRGAGCTIHPSAVVSEKVWLGDNVRVEAHASIADYSVIGSGSFIGSGARIGADGLQSIDLQDRKLFVRHAGGVKLGDRVVVLANAVISRGVHPVFTVVGDDTHLSLLSSIGHQSDIGSRCSIAGNCLIGGSVKMGHDVVLGPSVTIKDGVTIGSGARIRLGSVVVENVVDRADISGNFAINHTSNIRNYTRLRHGARQA
jgi:UDP-3-O-[3-hydroxymyristoyl] glucosamine N-acyltransferase